MHRNKVNGRFYASKEDLSNYLDKLDIPYKKDDSSLHKINIIYARVSSNAQKQKGDLERQAGYICRKCKQDKPLEVITDVGSGLNANPKGLNKLIRNRK